VVINDHGNSRCAATIEMAGKVRTPSARYGLGTLTVALGSSCDFLFDWLWCLGNAPWKELIDGGDRVVAEALEHKPKLGFWIEAIRFGGANEGAIGRLRKSSYVSAT
jgi:hypothetical protein